MVRPIESEALIADAALSFYDCELSAIDFSGSLPSNTVRGFASPCPGHDGNTCPHDSGSGCFVCTK